MTIIHSKRVRVKCIRLVTCTTFNRFNKLSDKNRVCEKASKIFEHYVYSDVKFKKNVARACLDAAGGRIPTDYDSSPDESFRDDRASTYLVIASDTYYCCRRRCTVYVRPRTRGVGFFSIRSSRSEERNGS